MERLKERTEKKEVSVWQSKPWVECGQVGEPWLGRCLRYLATSRCILTVRTVFLPIDLHRQANFRTEETLLREPLAKKQLSVGHCGVRRPVPITSLSDL